MHSHQFGQKLCLDESMETRHHTNLDWLCVVRHAFCSAGREYEGVSTEENLIQSS